MNFMINQQILDYIKQQTQQGVGRDQIKNSLVTNGWQPSDVEEAFNSVNARTISNPSSSTSISISYAGFWLRGAAFLIDTFIFTLVLGVLTFTYSLLVAKNDPSLADSARAILNTINLSLWVLYFPFMESRGGATFGKKLVGIKVLSADGEPISFTKSLGRNLAKMLSAAIFMIGYIMAGFTEKKQGLHDIIANSIVVRNSNTNSGRIWTVILLIVVACIGTLVMAGSQFLFMLSNMFSNNSNTRVSFSENSNSHTTSKDTSFTPLTKEEYDSLFSEQITGLDEEKDYNGPHTYAGPALIAFDDFWGLNIALPMITNLENSRDYVWIDLSSVVSRSGQEILDSESSFEKDIFFRKLNLQKKTRPFDFLYNHRQIHLINGSTNSDIQTIEGTLFIKVPLDSKDSKNFYEKSYPFTITI